MMSQKIEQMYLKNSADWILLMPFARFSTVMDILNLVPPYCMACKRNLDYFHWFNQECIYYKLVYIFNLLLHFRLKKKKNKIQECVGFVCQGFGSEVLLEWLLWKSTGGFPCVQQNNA